jgi:hypothetical protein
MTNGESPNEAQARAVVESFAGITLTHADTNGDVDYRFTTTTGQRGAVEVTTVTSPTSKVALVRWDRESPKFGPATALMQCWQVWIDDVDVNYRGLTNRLEPVLAVLEAADRRFERWRSHEFIGSPRAERDAAQVLLQEHVEMAMPYPELCRAEGHAPPHRIEIVRQSGYSASGSDAALSLIESELNEKPDNFGKLRGADEKHLFVWLDAETDLAIARPFRGGQPTEWDHFKLPSRAPALLEPVHHLWIVDRATLTGWVWTSEAGWDSIVKQ